MRIYSKQEMYALHEKGKLGNTLLHWSYRDYLNSNYNGLVGLRYKGQAGQVYPEYSRPKTRDELVKLVSIWLSLGAKEDLISVNEVTYDKKFSANLELMRSEDYLYVRSHYDPNISCREAMTKDDVVTSKGLKAVFLLKSLLGEAGYIDLMDLFDLYPCGIVEMTTFNELVGQWSKPYVVWEVRTDY